MVLIPALQQECSDVDNSNPSSGKSSLDLERLMEETTSEDEIDFGIAPPTSSDEEGPSYSRIRGSTGEILDSSDADFNPRGKNKGRAI